MFAPQILRGIGCEVVELDCNLDFTFPKYNPNPEDLEMLHAIAKAVKDSNADVGFGFDGDGDRVGVIDNKGEEIFSDKIGLLIARNLAPKYKGSKFIVDVKSMKLPESVVVAHDIRTSGNTSSASIPLAMDALLAEKPELHGKNALLVGFGAGLVYAGQVVELPSKPVQNSN